MYTAINQAFSLFESTDDSILRMMVVLSDGNTSDRGMHSSVVTSATRNNIGHVFSWLPTTEQWLITGFNANIKNLDPSVMVSVGSVDLSSKTSIYDGLKSTKKVVLKDLTDAKYRLFKNNILLDDYTKTVWFIW